MEYDKNSEESGNFGESSTTKQSLRSSDPPFETLSATGSASSVRPEIARAEVFDTTPERLGHYEIRGEIGKGGMGTIYRGEHVFLRRYFAVKVINPRLLNDETVSGYFSTEMLMMGSLQHPNIVQTTDAGNEGGRRYIVMELLDGSDLSKYVKESGPLPIGTALAYLRQAAAGLEAAHRIGIVHRDVKPSNLFLTKDGTVKLLDLGLAKCLCQKDEVRTGHFVGSPGFTAPEQISGGESDARSDVYSLGCTFYYLLTGHAPFESPRYPNVKSILEAQLTEELPSLETHRDDLNRNAKDLIDRMTSKNPDERFQSMSELISALDEPRNYISRQKKIDPSSRIRRFVFAVSAVIVLIAVTLCSLTLPVLESFGKCTTQACKNRSNAKPKLPPVESECRDGGCHELFLCIADQCREHIHEHMNGVCEHDCDVPPSD